MKKAFKFLEKIGVGIYQFLFVKSPLLKIILAFLAGLIMLVIVDKTGFEELWLVGLVCFTYAFIMIIIGTIYAFIVNPFRRRKKEKENDNN